MYKLSYVVRVSTKDLDELKRRCDEVKDFYDDLSIKLVRPFGDMLGLHGEFIPVSKRYINDYIQYVTSANFNKYLVIITRYYLKLKIYYIYIMFDFCINNYIQVKQNILIILS